MLYRAKLYHTESDNYNLLFVTQDEDVQLTEEEKSILKQTSESSGIKLDDHGLFDISENQLLTLRLNYEEVTFASPL